MDAPLPPPDSFPPPAGAPPPRPRAPGLTTAALVLGILSPLTCGLTILPAVVCGIAGLVRMRHAPAGAPGRGRALAGLILGGVALPLVAIAGIVAAIAIPNVAQARKRAEQAQEHARALAEQHRAAAAEAARAASATGTTVEAIVPDVTVRAARPPDRAIRSLDDALVALADPPRRSAALVYLRHAPIDPLRQREVAARLETLDDTGDLQGRALEALAVWADEASVPALAHAIGSVTIDANTAADWRTATRALGRLRAGEASHEIARGLMRTWTTRDACEALRRIGPPAEKALAPYARESIWRVRVEAIKVLGAIGTRDSIEILEAGAADPNRFVAEVARDALRAVREREERGGAPAAPRGEAPRERTRGEEPPERTPRPPA